MKTHNGNPLIEKVLILQGGGALGAYECGVYNALCKHKIKFDILTGTSIGAINASIICAAQNESLDIPKILTKFWLDLAENMGIELWPTSYLPGFVTNDRIKAYFSSLRPPNCLVF